MAISSQVTGRPRRLFESHAKAKRRLQARLTHGGWPTSADPVAERQCSNILTTEFIVSMTRCLLARD